VEKKISGLLNLLLKTSNAVREGKGMGRSGAQKLGIGNIEGQISLKKKKRGKVDPQRGAKPFKENTHNQES